MIERRGQSRHVALIEGRSYWRDIVVEGRCYIARTIG